MHRNLPAFFRVSVFQPTELVTVETGRWVSVEDLIQRTLTYSSSPEALGENVEAMLRSRGMPGRVLINQFGSSKCPLIPQQRTNRRCR